MDFGAVDGAEVREWVRVMVDGRECAMREEGLRGYWVLKGPKPVMSTLISSDSEDCVGGGAMVGPGMHNSSSARVEAERQHRLKFT